MSLPTVEAGGSGHLMRTEILEQPEVYRRVAATVGGFLTQKRLRGPLSASFLNRVSRAVVFGSGSSFHAALLARDYLEVLGGIPSRAAHASEVFRWMEPKPNGVLALAMSHSGGSTDVRAAVRRARRQGIATAAVTNIDDSPLAREADAVLVTGAGAERAIPSTKGFTAAIAASYLLASHARAARGGRTWSPKSLLRLASRVETWLENEESARAVEGLASVLARARVLAFLGRGLLYPVACDAALKFLEVTYSPALAFPPDEFRHGPAAVVQEGFALVVLAPARSDTLISETRSRGAEVVVVGSSTPGAPSLPLPRGGPLLAPLVYAPALQLLAHAVGARLDRPIDRPRYLQKIVS
jgi:glucosamine--fructose-6-phosphate aminotransferase (isomerizing)